MLLQIDYQVCRCNFLVVMYRHGTRFYPNAFCTVDQLGPNRYLTPKRFLLCKVSHRAHGRNALCPHEILVQAGPDCMVVRIVRDADAVFNADTIASFQGKPVTLDDSTAEVNASYWVELQGPPSGKCAEATGASENLASDSRWKRPVRVLLRQRIDRERPFRFVGANGRVLLEDVAKLVHSLQNAVLSELIHRERQL